MLPASDPSRLPHTIVVLAMSADGKIADRDRSPARFGSAQDKAHLEARLAEVDAALFGAGTLRAYGTTLPIKNPDLLDQRQQQGKPPQPVHIVCSASGDLNAQFPFFRQNVPRWLLTTETGAKAWQEGNEFDRILIFTESSRSSSSSQEIDWHVVLHQLAGLGITKLLVMGGGELIASLLAVDRIDELWLTVCPLLLGGTAAPTPVEGSGFPANLAPRLALLAVEAIDQEVFLHYRVH
jgi:5-amino-6-(5-phosphoribosylamino)uracil reductase